MMIYVFDLRENRTTLQNDLEEELWRVELFLYHYREKKKDLCAALRIFFVEVYALL